MSTWNTKLDAIRGAFQSAAHGFDNPRSKVQVRFAGEECGAYGDPYVTLELGEVFEETRRVLASENIDGTLQDVRSKIELVTLDVRVETIDFQETPSAISLASGLHTRCQEHQLTALLKAADIVMAKRPGPVRSMPYVEDETKIHAFVFEVTLRTETSEEDPTSVNVFEHVNVTGLLQPDDIVVELGTLPE